ncbi:pancreatic triacylglycerol lipase [Folsomia candida]|nr:pancreatic triacylglycerol lipase [Folsomia candida]
MFLKIASLFLAGFVASCRCDQYGVSSDVNTLKFYYFRNANEKVEIVYGDTNSLKASKLKKGRPTTLLIDGFLSSYPSNMSVTLMESLVGENWGKSQTNVIVLDWGSMSGGHSPLLAGNLPYAMYVLAPIVAANVPPVGVRVAEFVEFLRVNKRIERKNVHIIGHSMGAHIAGNAGKYSNVVYTPIGRLTGLDPANADTYPTSLVLYKTDADLVDLYHTNRGGLGEARTGSGDLDVYINGGNNQPGCNFVEIVPGYCSHSYSWKFYAATISGLKFGCPCSTTDPAASPTCFCNPSCNDFCWWKMASFGHYVFPRTTGSYHVTVTDTFQ